MKKISLLAAIAFVVTSMWSQKDNGRIPLIGDTAPSFTTESTVGKINFPQDYANSWKIIFSHPRDFTPVCSSELLELAYMQNDFNELNVKLLVLSTDLLSQHFSWKKALEEIEYKGNPTTKIEFPLVPDDEFKISRLYGMLHTPVSTTRDVRGVYIIDPDNVIRSIVFYPMEVGRNIDEIKRTIIALQTTRENNLVVTPANWAPGGDVLLHHLTTENMAKLERLDPSVYQVSWFMTFKQAEPAELGSLESSFKY
jgi:peroxiredoxin (alkyl hydroperoxide reductase subunit C)